MTEDVSLLYKTSGMCFSWSMLMDESILTSYSGTALPIFHPEFGRFMLEATPGQPWGIGFRDLLDVESNMKLRLDHSLRSRL